MWRALLVILALVSTGKPSVARDCTGSDDYLSNGAAVATAVPITMACWFNSDSATAAQVLMCLGASDNRFTLAAMGSVAGDPVRVTSVTGGTAVTADTTTGYTAGTWHHGCAVFASTTSRTAYIDGGSSASNTDLNVPLLVDKTHLGVNNLITGDTDGRIAEAAIWDVALTAAEVATLAKGYSPLFVRPSSLLAYWPLIGNQSPEIDWVGGFDLTITGTVDKAAHPRIIYPRTFKTGAPAAAAFDAALFPWLVTNSPVLQRTEVVSY